MSASHVVVLAPPTEREVRESTAQKIHRLQAEARALAREQLEGLGAALEEVSLLASGVVEGGDIYPPGAPEMAKWLLETCEKQSLALASIAARGDRQP